MKERVRARHPDPAPAPTTHANRDPARSSDRASDLGQRGGHSFENLRVFSQTAPDTAAPEGQPATVTSTFEAAFDADFSEVGIERDGRAERLGTKAFAQGETIHLSGSAPPPESREGRALLGHEMTHVVQQRQGRVPAPTGTGEPIVADRALEAEADSVGARVARGEPAPASMQGVGGQASATAAQGKPERAPIQMFGALEHKAMGDRGARTEPYRWDTASEAASGQRDGNVGFTLTHGDIVMLSGDLFDAREKDEQGKDIPDNLFQLARTPGNFGAAVGTQDEIMYAIYKENPNDIRFRNVCIVPGRQDEHGVPQPSVTFPLKPDPKSPLQPYFSEEVKKTVDMRYLNLAARNRDHFANPDGAGSGGPKSGNFRSAGGSYRAMHESAILAAFNAGQSGKPIDEAMAYEAAAQHYLTDSFAGGHLRTPTGAIKAHWDGIYPNFWENLKAFIVHEMAIQMNEETNAATIAGTVSVIEDTVRTKMDEKVAAYPPMGFERLVALATHDLDNREGVSVVNDLGERWTAYGDGQMKYPDKDDSQKRAIEAVELGCKDIQDAYKMPIVIVDPCGALQVDGPTGRKYRSEQKMPRVDDATEKTQQKGWAAANIDDLWKAEIRSGSGYTYGAEFESSAKKGDIADQIGGMAEMIDEKEEVWKGVENDWVTAKVYLGTLHPRAAFEKGVLKPIQSDTYGTLKRIINFNPSGGHAWFNEDDAAMEEMDRMEARDATANAGAPGGAGTQDSFKGMTLDQRASFVKSIVGGTFSYVSESEEERIVKIFETCPVGDRRQLYRMIEGHDWEGDYKEGWLTDDDELYNSLSGAELKRVRDLINGK